MTKTILISMMALIATASAEPYFSALSSYPYYGAWPGASAVVPGALPAIAPGPVSALPTTYSATLPATVPAAYSAELAYSPYYNVPNYASLASPYSLPASYGYAYGDYIYRR